MAVGIWWTLDVYHENICTYCFSCKIFCKRVKWLIVFDFKHARCFINPRFADCLFIRKNVVITWKPVFFNMMQLRCCKPFFHSVFLRICSRSEQARNSFNMIQLRSCKPFFHSVFLRICKQQGHKVLPSLPREIDRDGGRSSNPFKTSVNVWKSKKKVGSPKTLCSKKDHSHPLCSRSPRRTS